MTTTSDNLPLAVVVDDVLRAPPHPLDGEWYIHTGSESFGPYSGHRIREFVDEGRVTAQTDVARVGEGQWVKASTDSSLAAFFPTATFPSAPPLPTNAGAVSAAPGATIVQVTNHLAPAPSVTPQILVEAGPAKPKSAGLALVLSILCVGLGQVYNGQVGKGILMFFLCVATWFIMLGWIVMLWSWVDAYRNAKAMNERYQRRTALGILV